MIKVRYVGDYYKVSLKKGKLYNARILADGMYAIVDESGDEYVFAPAQFEVI